jgi:predicted alpha/beta superfamily hydrolase
VLKSYPEATIFHSEARSLVSSIVGQEYRIPVWLPPGYATSDRTYPVLYLLDADVFFGLAADSSFILLPEIPEMIVVGIGYPIQSYEDWIRLRTRDLGPTAWAERPGSGGASDFLAFLRTELIPFVEASYRADPTDRALSGYSLGGVFVLYALLSEPGLFRRYAAGGATASWGDGFFPELEAEYAAQHRALPVRFFLATGSLDARAPAIKDFDAILRARSYVDFRYEFAVLEGETHNSGAAPAFVRGLKWLFAADITP